MPKESGASCRRPGPSALNHPNIVTIYDIDQTNGVDFIAMEYVPGKTLDSLLGRRGLKVSEALKYVVQIADALTSAHAAGIVHRDIKPANIMVTENGLIKVLDFGLAKLTEAAESEGIAETRTLREKEQTGTGEGAILGTVAYMSPEQAQGQKVDARSDIFSFGAVLYEMLSGRRAFEGETKMATLASVIQKEPAPLSGIPHDLERVVMRCLRKDAERRFQLMKEVKIALEDLKRESESGSLIAVTPAPPKRGRPWVIILPVFALAAGLAGFAWWKRSSTQPAQDVILRPLTADSGLTSYPAVSPDGKLVAYASDRANDGNLDIWIQQLAGGQAIRLTRDEADDIEPAFSPDSSQIAFRSEREGGGIYVISTLGGEERLIARDGRRPRFSPDGKWIAYSAGRYLAASHIYILPSSGEGSPRQVAADIPWATDAVWSPDGQRILLLGSSDPTGGLPRDWYVASLNGTPSIQTGASSLLQAQTRYLPSPGEWVGDRVVFSIGNLWQVKISPQSWQVSGLQRLTTGSAREVFPSAVWNSQTEGRFRVIFAAVNSTTDLWSLSVDGNSGKVRREARKLTQDSAAKWYPSLSSDGKKLLFTYAGPENRAIRIRDLETGKERTLAVSRVNIRPKLSPDGSKVAYVVFEPQQLRPIYLVPTTGGESEKLCDNCGQIYGWSPDSQKLLYWSGNPIQFSLLDVASHQRTELIGHPKYNIHGAEYSPDGRWIPFQIPFDARREPVFVVPVRDGKAAGEGEWITVVDRSVHNQRPWWSPDGNLLYFISQLDGFPCIWAQRLNPSDKRPIGSPLAVQHFHGARRTVPFSGLASFGPGVSRDQIVYSISDLTGNIWMADLPTSN